MEREIKAAAYYINTQLKIAVTREETSLHTLHFHFEFFEKQLQREMRKAYAPYINIENPDKYMWERQIDFNQFPYFVKSAASHSGIGMNVLKLLNRETILVVNPGDVYFYQRGHPKCTQIYGKRSLFIYDII